MCNVVAGLTVKSWISRSKIGRNFGLRKSNGRGKICPTPPNKRTRKGIWISEKLPCEDFLISGKLRFHLKATKTRNQWLRSK